MKTFMNVIKTRRPPSSKSIINFLTLKFEETSKVRRLKTDFEGRSGNSKSRKATEKTST